jgi:hypothetical protein
VGPRVLQDAGQCALTPLSFFRARDTDASAIYFAKTKISLRKYCEHPSGKRAGHGPVQPGGGADSKRRQSLNARWSWVAVGGRAGRFFFRAADYRGLKKISVPPPEGGGRRSRPKDVGKKDARFGGGLPMLRLSARRPAPSESRFARGHSSNFFRKPQKSAFTAPRPG